MTPAVDELLDAFQKGSRLALARIISLVENEVEGHWELLKRIESKGAAVWGITGPPGAGKSTLVNALLGECRSRSKSAGVIAVDPSSAFSHGSLLGDRIRMPTHFLDDQIFIRSLSSRSALGGLSFKTQEVCDVMKGFGFDYIFIETVGVGQSEIEIAGLADQVALVLVPGAGDEIQSSKSGIIEIGDVYVVNKADAAGADALVASLRLMLLEQHLNNPVIKVEALRGEHVGELFSLIENFPHAPSPQKAFNKAKTKLLSILHYKKMMGIDYRKVDEVLTNAFSQPQLNLYRLAEEFF